MYTITNCSVSAVIRGFAPPWSSLSTTARSSRWAGVRVLQAARSTEVSIPACFSRLFRSTRDSISNCRSTYMVLTEELNRALFLVLYVRESAWGTLKVFSMLRYWVEPSSCWGIALLLFGRSVTKAGNFGMPESLWLSRFDLAATDLWRDLNGDAELRRYDP